MRPIATSTGLTKARADALYSAYTVNQGRLTGTTGTPVTTADVNAAATLYFTPYAGDQIGLYDGSNWHVRTYTEQSIGMLQSYVMTTTSGSKILSGAGAITTQLVRGMVVSGTGIAANSVISTIDSTTQVTLNNNATANGTVSI